MNHLLVGLIVGTFVFSAPAQGVTTAPPGASPAPPSVQAAPAQPGETVQSGAAGKADASRKSTTRHKKKAKKSASHTAGVKVKAATK